MSNHSNQIQGSSFTLPLRAFEKDSKKPVANFPTDAANIKVFILKKDDSGVIEFTGATEITDIDAPASAFKLNVLSAKSVDLKADERMDIEAELTINSEPVIVCFPEVLTIKERLVDRA